MAKREDRNERKSRATGEPQLYSSAKWITDNKKGGDRLAFQPPAGLPVIKLEKDKVYRWSVVPFITGKRNPNPSCPPGNLFWNRTYEAHPRLGPNKETVLCLAVNFKKRCPCCDENERIWRIPQGQVSLEQKEHGKALRAKKRTMMLVYDHDQPHKGLQFFEDSFHSFGETFKTKLARFAGKPEWSKYDLHFDPKAGCVLHVGTTEKQIGTGTWVFVNDIEFHKRDKSLPLAIVKQAQDICLDDLIADNEPKAAYIKSLMVPPDDEVDPIDPEDHEEEEEDGEEAEGQGFGEEAEAEDQDADAENDGEESDDGGDDDWADDDDEEDTEDPAPEVGDVVTFLRKGVRVAAKVIAVKGDKAKVRFKDGEEVVKPLADLAKKEVEKPAANKPKKEVEKPKKEVEKPAAKKPKKPAKVEEDDDDADADAADDDDFSFDV